MTKKSICRITLLGFLSITFLNVQLSSQCVEDCGTSTRYGNQAGFDNMGTSLTAFGNHAGFNNEGDKNSFFGHNSGSVNSGAEENAFFGFHSGRLNDLGGGNSFFGAYAGENNTLAAGNSFFGFKSGQSMTTAEHNSFFGLSSGQLSTGGSNSFFGSNAGAANTVGAYNTFVGAYAGSGNTTGSHNIYIGHNVNHNSVDGDKKDSTLLIGLAGGFPLITGHFGKKQLTINGSLDVYGSTRLFSDFEVSGAFFGGSSRHIKQNLQFIDKQDVLKKVITLPITTWEYINSPDVRHIGPMAQDFHAAFGLGKDDVTIATVDADGLAFASIQALHDLLQEEKKRNDRLEKKVEQLIILIGRATN